MSAGERIAAHEAVVGEGMRIKRALPTVARRLVGPWCFLDHFGPVDVSTSRGMRVGPHPHTGLQTVTWLLEGEVLHRDSLGSEQLIRPGQLNLMTAGQGISHSEESPAAHPPRIHGVQLWIALPEAARRRGPSFNHYASLPQVERDGALITVLAGQALGQRSPAAVHSPLVGLDLSLRPGASLELPLRGDFEHGLLVLGGSVDAGGEPLEPGTLLYLARGHSSVSLSCSAAAHAVLVGGEPFAESVLMWWNFVARTREELSQACRDWNAQAAYLGEVKGYDGARLVAPMPPWAVAPDPA